MNAKNICAKVCVCVTSEITMAYGNVHTSVRSLRIVGLCKCVVQRICVIQQ